jgi:uncharacterized hydrophobic protein (TIGR00271 family)
MAHGGSPLQPTIEKLLRIDPDDKQKVYASVFDAADLSSLNYWLEIIFSAGIATLGLVLNSPAVVIGAMLVSPLMGPILAAGLALAAADLYLGVKSLLNILASVLVAVSLSALVVWVLPFHTVTTEVLARTQPNLLDLAVAVFSGLAGSVVVCRGGGGGGVTALPGVAIAVALMPPLCTVGFGVGSGWNWQIISGAMLLFVTNLAAIIASGFVVFLAVNMNDVGVREQIDATIRQRASRDWLYGFLTSAGLSDTVGHIGKLRWRVGMLAGVLALLFFPLTKSLLQVRDEAIARAAVRETTRRLVPASSIVSERVSIGADAIEVGLVTTEQVQQGEVEKAQAVLEARTGKRVVLQARKVADQEELAQLRDRLVNLPVFAAAAPQPMVPPEFAQARQNMLPRLEGPLTAVWPAQTAPLQDYEIALTRDRLVVRVRYSSTVPLTPAFRELVENLLRKQLNAPELVLELERVRAPRRAR